MNQTSPVSADYFFKERTCPICNREHKLTKKRTLYGYPVCKKCRNAFLYRRQAAFLTDIVAILFPMMCLSIIFEQMSLSSTILKGLEVCALIAFSVLLVCKDALSGMSLGKRLFALQVIDTYSLEPIGLKASIKRNLPLIIPYFTLIIWLIADYQMMFGPRIGDGWAKTLVIWRKHAHKPPFIPRGIYCLVCDYNLTSNVSGICPECGTPIPQQIRSFLEMDAHKESEASKISG